MKRYTHEDLSSGPEGLTAREIGELKIPAIDRRRYLLRLCLTERQLRIFACDCATRALERDRAAGHKQDIRSTEAIRIARLYTDGSVNKIELFAAHAAAVAVASWTEADAHWSAAFSAVRSAAGAAADSASRAIWAASKDSEKEYEWQIARAVELAEADQ